MFRTSSLLVITTLSLAGLHAGVHRAVAQPGEPIAPPPDTDVVREVTADDEGVEMLTRGAVHEAFADQASEDPVAGLETPVAPPEPIDELPPEVKPEGDDIIWIPGYWYWDVEREDYIWISGVWRKQPPGRTWVPGYWAEVDGKYRRVSGMWSGSDVAELEYLPDPPASLEGGPVSPAPADDYFWVPGCWVYRYETYRWRPGYWDRFRDDRVWIPTRYIWSPRGCLYQAGYWDYPLAVRGQLYSPVYFHRSIYATAHCRFRPSVTISTNSIFLHLFVRSGHSHYYFGDYYGNRHRTHYHPWYEYQRIGRRYDPLITHARGRSHRAGVDYVGRMRDWHRYFTTHADHRPPTTIKAQRTFVAAHRDLSHLKHVTLGRSHQEALRDDRGRSGLRRIPTAQHADLHRRANEVRSLAELRRRRESARGPERSSVLASQPASPGRESHPVRGGGERPHRGGGSRPERGPGTASQATAKPQTPTLGNGRQPGRGRPGGRTEPATSQPGAVASASSAREAALQAARERFERLRQERQAEPSRSTRPGQTRPDPTRSEPTRPSVARPGVTRPSVTRPGTTPTEPAAPSSPREPRQPRPTTTPTRAGSATAGPTARPTTRESIGAGQSRRVEATRPPAPAGRPQTTPRDRLSSSSAASAIERFRQQFRSRTGASGATSPLRADPAQPRDPRPDPPKRPEIAVTPPVVLSPNTRPATSPRTPRTPRTPQTTPTSPFRNRVQPTRPTPAGTSPSSSAAPRARASTGRSIFSPSRPATAPTKPASRPTVSRPQPTPRPQPQRSMGSSRPQPQRSAGSRAALGSRQRASLGAARSGGRRGRPDRE